MITNQNNYNYSSLFAAASQALGLNNPDEYISSLNEYFANIEELAQKDLKFTILPLDEEIFEINANTRTITVPASFKNGVGVKGDQVAEILYFKINRYFDATDLNTQNIYIEWENAKGDQGLSKEYVRDIVSNPDYIIFGWPLDSRITEHEGKVKFAIRFYSFDNPEAENKKIIYSFGTQPQTIIINNTMDFNIEDDSIQDFGEDINDMIKNRFQNSERDDVETDVPAPNFSLQLIPGEYDVSDADGYDNNDDNYTLKAQAVGTGYVSYVLKRAEPGSTTWINQANDSVKLGYVLTTDAERNPLKVYYTKVEKENEGIFAYEIYNGDVNENTNKSIYEQYCFATISTAGDYIIQAKNRVGISSKTKDSEKVTFPNPIKPIIKGAEKEYLSKILDNGETTLSIEFTDNGRPNKGTIIYKWEDANGEIANEVSNTYNVTTEAEESYYYATAIHQRNNKQVASDRITYRVTKPAQTPEVLSPTEDIRISKNSSLEVKIKTEGVPYDSIKVQWYKSNGADIDITKDEKCGEPVEIGVDGVAIYSSPTLGNIYYAQVILNRNGSEATVLTNTWTIIN